MNEKLQERGGSHIELKWNYSQRLLTAGLQQFFFDAKKWQPRGRTAA
jgi:hypothetical protein